MPSIFLSHTSIDKAFVEKLAYDLKRIGVNVWFDKWEIKVGDSITWRVENGIRENEFLGIVLSPEALASEWVKSELGAAWVKQMQTKKVILLPILYRDCDIPLFLADRKYADFRLAYQLGFEDLAGVLGIEQLETITGENWRKFAKNKSSQWQVYRKLEFEQLVTTLIDRAVEYNWSSWVGGTKNPFSISLHAYIDRSKKEYISLKLNGKTLSYMASFIDESNPNNLRTMDFTIYVGNSINECEEFVWRRMEDFKSKVGNPIDKAYHFTERFLRGDEKDRFIKNLINDMRWYKGDKI